MTIDYKAKELTFEPVDYEIRDLMKTLPERLAGPKVAREVVLAPSGLWGLDVDKVLDVVTITDVAPGSPAAASGLKPRRRAHDARRPLDRFRLGCLRRGRGRRAGKPVEVIVVRDGKEMTLSVAPRPGF